MTVTTALGLVKAGSFQVPALIADIGPEATKRYFEFFTVPIRNKNTRIAYYHAIGQFLDWCQRAGFRDLEDIEPITVAAYVEQHRDRRQPLSSICPRFGCSFPG
jgi:site-specific recombinase XerD